MNVMILGSNGMNGHMIAKFLQSKKINVRTVSRKNADIKFDLFDYSKLNDLIENMKEYEQKHLDIIKLFGRYPHRNEILGRESSQEERDFLVDNPGLNSGFMIPQYTAASIVSANKQMASPASIDSIVSSNGQEDHVSMGANAATQAYTLVKNVERVVAIELMNASQALEFRRPLKTSPLLESFLEQYRKVVPFIKADEVLHDSIEASIQFLKDVDIEIEELFLNHYDLK